MKLLAATLFSLTVAGLAVPPRPKTPATPEGAVQLAAICVKTGEKISGAVKTCFYNCTGEGRELTVSSRAVCPLTITY
jgi:hypothetical protein